MITIICFSFFYSFIFSVFFVYSLLGLLFSILFFSLLSSIYINFFCLSYFSYIIIIVYIGSLLIIFSYFVSLDRNQNFNFNIFFILYFYGVFCQQFCLKSNIFSFIFSLYYKSNYFILIILGFILLISLLGLIKLTFFSFGSLRSYF